MPSLEQNRVKVGLVGARGYSGRELARLLLRHPAVTFTATYASGSQTTGNSLAAILPERAAALIPEIGLDLLTQHAQENSIQVVFLATPVGPSIELASQLIEAGVHVIDLSGAFRLQEGSKEQIAATYKEWYQIEHRAPGLVALAEYGLRPWATQSPRSGARLIANPGCYATAILMGILPLLKSGIVDPSSLVIDAKSGTTGAGKKAEERLLHAEVEGLCLPYRVGRHQHEPELQQFARHFTGVTIDPHFTPHLLNTRRGIIAGLYARFAPAFATLSRDAQLEALDQAYASAYADYPLVEYASMDRGGEPLLNLRRVVGSARTQIAYQVENQKLYVFSLIDNLMKGAASQAVENLNCLLGYAPSLGLTETEGVL